MLLQKEINELKGDIVYLKTRNNKLMEKIEAVFQSHILKKGKGC